VRLAAYDQERAGLSILTDGEERRQTFSGDRQTNTLITERHCGWGGDLAIVIPNKIMARPPQHHFQAPVHVGNSPLKGTGENPIADILNEPTVPFLTVTEQLLDASPSDDFFLEIRVRLGELSRSFCHPLFQFLIQRAYGLFDPYSLANLSLQFLIDVDDGLGTKACGLCKTHGQSKEH